MIVKSAALSLCLSSLFLLNLSQAQAAVRDEKDYQTGPAYEHCLTGNTSFSSWRNKLAREARLAGVSNASLKLLKSKTPDSKVLARDKGQSFFNQDFLSFSGKVLSGARYTKGKNLMKTYLTSFERAERDFGVPAPVLVAFWGLESDFGANIGNFDTLRSLVTLAYDCRRPGLFRPQVIALLKLIDRGDIHKSKAKGAWAGELGQTQLLPSDYDQFALDYNKDGRRNLIDDEIDVIGSSAHMVANHGWRREEPWLVEVRLPKTLNWSLATIDNAIPVSNWSSMGITARDGRPLPYQNLPAKLIMPMGYRGPAFLAYPNFDVFTEWNQSLTYALTAAYFATRLDGAPKLDPRAGKQIAINEKDVKRLQSHLVKRGYDVGGVDGTLGYKSRGAIRAEQKRLGFPADGYPSRDFLRVLLSGY